MKKDGLRCYVNKADYLMRLIVYLMRLIVPEPYRDELVVWQHKTLLHAGSNEVTKALGKTYYWPDLRKHVKQAVTGCATCAI